MKNHIHRPYRLLLIVLISTFRGLDPCPRIFLVTCFQGRAEVGVWGTPNAVHQCQSFVISRDLGPKKASLICCFYQSIFQIENQQLHYRKWNQNQLIIRNGIGDRYQGKCLVSIVFKGVTGRL